MDIDLYISDLLYQHDCVIVPGFGGFVSTYAPAKIHPVTHKFQPPSKNILFNSKLTRDDGLLTDYIRQKDGGSYEDVKRQIEHVIWEITKKLDNRERVVLKDVGTLYRGYEGRINFEPDESINYLEDSFGLPSFVSPPIARKGYTRRREPIFADRREGRAEDRRLLRKAASVVAIVALLFTFGWFLFNSDFLRQRPAQQANMVKIPDSGADTYAVESLKPATAPVTIPLKDVDFSEEAIDEAVSVAEAEITPEVIPEPAPLTLYHIIGGAFSNESNADKLVLTLRAKGFNAQRPGLSPSGLHMVSYFATPDKDEALLNLAIIRNEENPSAWLLKR